MLAPNMAWNPRPLHSLCPLRTVKEEKWTKPHIVLPDITIEIANKPIILKDWLSIKRESQDIVKKDKRSDEGDDDIIFVKDNSNSAIIEINDDPESTAEQQNPPTSLKHTEHSPPRVSSTVRVHPEIGVRIPTKDPRADRVEVQTSMLYAEAQSVAMTVVKELSPYLPRGSPPTVPGVTPEKEHEAVGKRARLRNQASMTRAQLACNLLRLRTRCAALELRQRRAEARRRRRLHHLELGELREAHAHNHLMRAKQMQLMEIQMQRAALERNMILRTQILNKG